LTAPAYLGLAEICWANKDYSGAVAWNKTALAHDDTLFNARVGIAKALSAQGHVEEAIAQCSAVSPIFPRTSKRALS
jgi:hypothetical protein